MKYCKTCVYPEIAVNLDISKSGECSACLTAKEIKKISSREWKRREMKLIEIIDKSRKFNEGDYDCIIPVGGGKDSYYQVHKITSLGFKPLLVTYHGNNYLDEGQENLNNMRKHFKCDHIIFYPGEEELIKLNRAAFKMMGDMNWHNHAGIRIIPSQMAVKYKVSVFIWGEIAWDISGMFSHNDFVEFNKRMVLEHDMRGFVRKDFIGKEGINNNHLKWCELPSDEDFKKHNLKGIYLGNFVSWDPYKQTEIIKKKYNWEEARRPFERTYRKISNLDDMHENGIHDYMKWIKFGYGRCSDHVSKDIRLGYMNRKEGIKLVKKYDSIKPKRDLKRWLEYVNLTEQEFDKIADRFRDPRVWKKEGSSWLKDNIWDKN